jgi:fructose-specific phosphotransferase system IIC component
MRKILVTFIPGLVAGCVGGVIGFFVFDWIRQQGFFAPVIPGALAGLACGFCSVDHSKVRGILCALIAFAAGMTSYWLRFSPPFETDGSLLDLIKNCYQLNPVTQIMLALGTVLGFWWGRETTSPLRHRFASVASKPLTKPDQSVIDE